MRVIHGCTRTGGSCLLVRTSSSADTTATAARRNPGPPRPHSSPPSLGTARLNRQISKHLSTRYSPGRFPPPHQQIITQRYPRSRARASGMTVASETRMSPVVPRRTLSLPEPLLSDELYFNRDITGFPLPVPRSTPPPRRPPAPLPPSRLSQCRQWPMTPLMML